MSSPAGKRKGGLGLAVIAMCTRLLLVFSSLLSASVVEALPQSPQPLWVWEGGSSALNIGGSYGTRGIAVCMLVHASFYFCCKFLFGLPQNATNMPGTRYDHGFAFDSTSNLRWLFAGSGYRGGNVACFCFCALIVWHKYHNCSCSR